MKRYQLLRSDLNGQTLFDNKTLDFVGFLATVVVFVGTLIQPSSALGSDKAVLNQFLATLEQLALANECNVASQCRRSLQALMDAADGKVPHGYKISVPYFGTLSIRQPSWPRRRTTSGTSAKLAEIPTNDSCTSEQADSQPQQSGYNEFAPPSEDMDWSEYLHFEGFDYPFNAMLDLNEDWTSILR